MEIGATFNRTSSNNLKSLVFSIFLNLNEIYASKSKITSQHREEKNIIKLNDFQKFFNFRTFRIFVFVVVAVCAQHDIYDIQHTHTHKIPNNSRRNMFLSNFLVQNKSIFLHNIYSFVPFCCGRALHHICKQKPYGC